MYKITAEQFKQLPEFAQTKYKEQDGAYVSTEAHPDSENYMTKVDYEAGLAAAFKAKQHEVDNGKLVKKELAEIKAKAAAEHDKNLRDGGKLDEIDAAWQTKFAEQKETSGKESAKYRTYIKKQLIEKEAERIANKISTTPHLMKLAIERRLEADFDGDEPKTVVLDGLGKRTISSLDDLEKEFANNKEYSAIIKGSKASGGSAHEGGDGDGSGGAKSLSDFKTKTEEAQFARENPDEYAEMSK